MSNRAQRYEQEVNICCSCGYEGTNFWSNNGGLALCSKGCEEEYSGCDLKDNDTINLEDL